MSGQVPTSNDPFDSVDADSPFAMALRQVQWPDTPFGPLASWPQSLRSAVSICLGTSFPIAIYWGPQLALVYNNDWSPILGSKHPWAMGRAASEVWPEIWETIGPLFDSVLKSGRATRSTDQLLAMHRHGFMEECYFDYTFSPIRGENGVVDGIFNAVLETTFRVIGERRTRLLRDLGEAVSRASSVEDVWPLAANVLSSDPHDVPLAALYLLDRSTGDLQSVGSLGVPSMGPLSEMAAAEDGALPLLTVFKTATQSLIGDLSARLGCEVIADPWPEACERALLAPVMGLEAARPEGVLVLGVSPRLHLDAEYQAFLERVRTALSGALIRVLTIQRDRNRAEQLAELDRAKTVFFSNISHEFRTPLTLMLGPLTDTLRDEALPAHLRAQVRMAERNALRLSKLVNALLEFSRIEAGRHKASFRPVDLSHLTQEIASTFRSAMERAGLEYAVLCSGSAIPAYVDVDMWERIVLNLLSNALKYTLVGRVELRLESDDSTITLQVADTGVGIPRSQLSKLFERFHRVDGTVGRTQEGSGIGLALVAELVKMHGGSTAVETQVGQGSTFTVTVPVGRDHLPGDQVLTASVSSSSTQHVAYVDEAMRWVDGGEDVESIPVAQTHLNLLGESYQNLKGARVVVADDNADMRQYLQRLLSPVYQVELVADGVDALAAIRRARPALLISDVMMPRLDGFGVLRSLREDDRLRTVPVILVSARAGEEARVGGLAAGADDYLVKPFTARELLARVGAVVALDQMRRVGEEHLRLGLANAQMFTWVIDIKSGRIGMSENAGLVFGNMPVTTQQGYALVHPDDMERHQRTIDAAIARRGRFEDEIRVFGRDGSTRWLEVRGTVITDSAGDPVTVSGLSFDITARKQMEDALRLADRRKDEFLAMLAHELRNPLAPIRNASELLRRIAVSDDRVNRSVDIIHRQSLHLCRLVDDLLDVSRITRGRVELHKEAMDLSSIVAPALESVEALFNARNHRVIVQPSLAPLPVCGDAIRLQQCLVNLLTNAGKYTEPGGVIEIALRRDEAWGVLSVSDNGLGIAPELLPDIFDLFVQSERTLDRAQGGLGIGLSVVRGLINLHGGTIEAHSDGIGQGSRFDARFPLVEAHAANDGASPVSKPRGFRILVVDDNRDAAESLGLLLRADDHEVAMAFSADDALAKAQSWHPEVMLLDIGLPGRDGYQVAKSLRSRQETAKIHLVALTGFGQEEDRRAALAAGFDDHLVKPAPATELRRLLGSLA